MAIVALLIGLVAGAAGVYAVAAAPGARRPRPGLARGPRGAARPRRDGGRAGRRAGSLRRAGRERDQGAVDRGAAREREHLHRAGDGPARRVRRAAEEVAREGRDERGSARAAAAAGVRRDPQGARDRRVRRNEGLRAADGQSRQRPARGVAHARPLGRDPAAAGDRDGRDALVLRLRRAADDRGGRRPACCART